MGVSKAKEEKVKAWEGSIEHFKASLKIDAENEASRDNLESVQKQLAELQEEKPEEEKKQDKENQKKQDSEKSDPKEETENDKSSETHHFVGRVLISMSSVNTNRVTKSASSTGMSLPEWEAPSFENFVKSGNYR